MLPVVWLDDAHDGLDGVIAFLAEHNPIAALELAGQIRQASEALGQFPYMGRPGRVAGTRELLLQPNYWAVYRVTVDRIEILDVLHARREYP